VIKFEQIAKRFIKAGRNLTADPPPRNKILAIRSVSVVEEGLRLEYFALKQAFHIDVELSAEIVGKIKGTPYSQLEPTLTAIAIAFSPFLFKLSDFRTVKVEVGSLDAASAKFFSRFMQGGLAEFRYLQGLNPKRPITVTAASRNECAPTRLQTEDRVLMLNGGGKDTIVAGELLKLGGQPFSWVTIRPNEARRSVVSLSGNSNSFEIGYQLDPKIEELKAYPWGHFPHTSIVLALGLLIAQLTGARYVCAGNEHSANYGNLIFRGYEVNHQYTKSFEYEKGFSDYVERCVTPDIKVFSILRPFHDLQLAKFFSRLTKYHDSFISCNRAITRNAWCKDCAKCAFTALALYPFVGAEGIARIFGENVINRPAIRRHIQDLVREGVKPWECVGTIDENRLALSMLLQANPDLEFKELPRRSDLVRDLHGFDASGCYQRLIRQTSRDHGIPGDVKVKLNHALEALGDPLIA